MDEKWVTLNDKLEKTKQKLRDYEKIYPDYLAYVIEPGKDIPNKRPQTKAECDEIDRLFEESLRLAAELDKLDQKS